MILLFRLLGVALLSYLLGSLSFALLITKVTVGIDVRDIGSKHATATNTMRAAGWAAGAIVMLLDISKGVVALLIAQRFGGSPWAQVVAAGFVVVGHCWPIFAEFRGGMGMASAGGAFLAIWPLGFALGLGVAALCQLVVRHSAKANVLTGLLLAPVWAVFGASWPQISAAGFAGLLLAFRARIDWERDYSELWWDRG